MPVDLNNMDNSIKNPVVVKLKGGMGNQMFQYAFGRALEETAKKTGQSIDLRFDITTYTNAVTSDTKRPYLLPLFNTDEIVLSNRNPYGTMRSVLHYVRGKLKPTNSGYFDRSLLYPPYKKYYEGYWQSEKYFLPIAKKLRQEFTLRAPLGRSAKEMYDRIATDPFSVSIFYRRTDYVSHPDFDIGEQDYQLRAIRRLQEIVPHFTLFVMSDDIEWVKEKANLPTSSVFVSSSEVPPEEEMLLTSACQHHIIPNSTFAWWGAWLDPNPNKIVIAPKEWVRSNNNEFRDIVPDSWIRA